MHIILLPLLVACFGWLISWGFIKIIFFPHQSIRLAGRQWQSLFSKEAGQISIGQILPELTLVIVGLGLTVTVTGIQDEAGAQAVALFLT